MENWGGILRNFEEDKHRKRKQELIRRERIGGKLHTTQEEARASDFGATISGDLGNSGNQSSLLEQQETDIDEKASVALIWEG